MSQSTSSSRGLDVGHFGYQVEDLPPWQDGAIDLKQWFPEDRRDLPLHMEIGSGKGTFLVQQAPQTPDVNYIGIEYAKAFWRHAADRVRRHALENVRLLHAEAAFFVRNYVADETFHQIHVYFPDPWPKSRHHKRRLLQASFFRECDRVLEPGGCIRIATDHSGYFEWIEDHAKQVEDIFARQPFERPNSAGEDELVGTNFERKYRREGRPFHGLILAKR